VNHLLQVQFSRQSKIMFVSNTAEVSHRFARARAKMQEFCSPGKDPTGGRVASAGKNFRNPFAIQREAATVARSFQWLFSFEAG
jgi:hypothetical protein